MLGDGGSGKELGVYVCEGNLSRGPLNIVMVFGENRTVDGCCARRAAGLGIYVTGPLGAAAACVRTGQMMPVEPGIDAAAILHYRPRARFDLSSLLSSAAGRLEDFKWTRPRLDHLFVPAVAGLHAGFSGATGGV